MIFENKMVMLVKGKWCIINVVLIGNFNCGKILLFNYVFGVYECIGNYSGVIVDVKENVFDF